MNKKYFICDFCITPCNEPHCVTNDPDFEPKNMKIKEKIKLNKEDLPKKRLPTAPPSRRHKSKKDYDRKKEKKVNTED